MLNNTRAILYLLFLDTVTALPQLYNTSCTYLYSNINDYFKIVDQQKLT